MGDGIRDSAASQRALKQPKEPDGPTVRLDIRYPEKWDTAFRLQAAVMGQTLSERIRDILRAELT